MRIAVCLRTQDPSVQNRIYVFAYILFCLCVNIYVHVYLFVRMSTYVCGRRCGCGRGVDVKVRKWKMN